MSGRASHVVPYVSIELPAVPGSVPAIRRRVSAFAAEHGATPELRAAIEIAVTESVTNVVRHAYPDDEPGTVEVLADVEEDALEVVVSDDGRGFVPGPSPGLGIGLGLMREHSGEFEIRDRRLGGVEVWMRFPLGRS